MLVTLRAWHKQCLFFALICSNKQQYNNAKPFPACVVEEVENYYECFKYAGICS